MWAATAVYYNMGTAVPESRTLFVDYPEVGGKSEKVEGRLGLRVGGMEAR